MIVNKLQENKEDLLDDESLNAYAEKLDSADFYIVDNVKYRKKKWYQKWWGILLIILILLFFLWVVFFIALTRNYVNQIKNGTADYDFKYFAYDFSPKYDVLAITQSDNDPYWGNPNAKVVVVEFGDYLCPHCRKFNAEIMPKLKEKYQDKILFIYRDYPILSEYGGLSTQLANLAQCVWYNMPDKSKFWEVHNYLFLMQGNTATIYDDFKGYFDAEKVRKCVTDEKFYNEVADDFRVANSLNVQGTPTFFINGHIMPYSVSLDEWVYILNRFVNYDENNK